MDDINNRPSWDQYFKEIVQVTAKRSSCNRLNVGCILVKDKRIIAQGYNGYIAGCQHKMIIKDNHNIATIHAEQNTITDCAKRGVSSDGCTAYITHYPCFNCIKFLAAAGIKEIKYIENYNNDHLVINIANIAKIKISQLKFTH